MKLPYQEGDWFAVPLPSGGYAVGVVARATRAGKVLLGYFFGPRREAAPRVEELGSLGPSSAVLVARFGDLGLIRNEWPILGSTGWDRVHWPMPAFESRDPLSGRIWRNQYADDDPNRLVGREMISETVGGAVPRDGVHGASSVENLLDRILSNRDGRDSQAP